MTQAFDLSRWRMLGLSERAGFGHQVDALLQRHGFLLVTGHGVPVHLREDLRAAGKQFFAMPGEAKQIVRVREINGNGWGPMGSLASSDSPDDANSFDLHEYFRAGPALRTGEPRIDRYYPGNLWPAGLPVLENAARAYIESMLSVVHSLLEVLASSLDLPTEFFAADTSHATWTLGINRYPTLHELGTVMPGQFRIGPHTDFGTITLLSRERGIGGLQVQERSGRWVDAPYLADSYLMIVGDMLDCWTDGRWPAVRHRVLPPSYVAPDEELFSLLFFFEANPDAVITPMREPRGGGKHWSPMVAGDYLMGRVNQVTLD